MELTDIALATSLFISFCAVVALAVHAPLQRRALREIAQRSHSDLLTAIDEVGTVAMRLDALEHGVRRLTQRIDQLQLAQQGSGQEGYDDAVSLVRAGAGTEQLVAQCGLSRGEAELLRRLHGHAA